MAGKEQKTYVNSCQKYIYLFISLLFPEIRFHYVQELGLTYVAKADLELTIFLPYPPKGYDCRWAPAHLVNILMHLKCMIGTIWKV